MVADWIQARRLTYDSYRTSVSQGGAVQSTAPEAAHPGVRCAESSLSCSCCVSALPLPNRRPTHPLSRPKKCPPLLSPQAAFDHASAPVDIIHRDVANWSDVEVNSLTTAIAQAKDACQTRTSETFTGSDLVAYARLCSLGKEWTTTYKAATTYINSRDPKPLLDQAYAFEVQAELNLGQPKSAVGACIAMMNSVPYGELTDEVTEAAVRYLQYAYTYDAITLLGARQPYVLHALNPSHPLPPSESAPSQPDANAATPKAASSSIPVHTLFEHALDFAAFEQYDNQPSMAASIVAQIDHNVPADLPSDEAIYIAADRRQYALIGTHFRTWPGPCRCSRPTRLPLRNRNSAPLRCSCSSRRGAPSAFARRRRLLTRSFARRSRTARACEAKCISTRCWRTNLPRRRPNPPREPRLQVPTGQLPGKLLPTQPTPPISRRRQRLPWINYAGRKPWSSLPPRSPISMPMIFHSSSPRTTTA